MEFLAAGFIIFALGMLALVFFVILYSLLLYVAAAIVDIAERSFGKAILSTIISFLSGIFLNFIPFIGWVISFAAGFIIPVVITQSIFNTTFVKAFLAELIRWCVVMFGTILLIFAVIGIIGFEAFQMHLNEAAGNLPF